MAVTGGVLSEAEREAVHVRRDVLAPFGVAAPGSLLRLGAGEPAAPKGAA
ncbi:hypothetical protein ACE1SV_16950 [Streptomyces sp. E-15]